MHLNFCGRVCFSLSLSACFLSCQYALLVSVSDLVSMFVVVDAAFVERVAVAL